MNYNAERMKGMGGAPFFTKGHANHKLHADNNYLYGLDLLCRKFLRKDYSILELGANMGASTSLFSKYCKKVTTVDRGKTPELGSLLSLNSNIFFVKQNAVEFGNQDENLYDFIYLDAGHDQKQVTDQLNTFIPKVKKNRLIGGHDYFDCGHSDVRKVVDKFFPDHIIHLFPDTSWLVEL